MTSVTLGPVWLDSHAHPGPSGPKYEDDCALERPGSAVQVPRSHDERSDIDEKPKSRFAP